VSHAIRSIQPFPSSPPSSHKHPEKLSELLERLAREAQERITMREIATALDDRSFGAFLLVFALPNLIPLPPGPTMVLGLPMIFVAWQMVMGYHKVWLPRAHCRLHRRPRHLSTYGETGFALASQRRKLGPATQLAP
jgi:hypothetical protein